MGLIGFLLLGALVSTPGAWLIFHYVRRRRRHLAAMAERGDSTTAFFEKVAPKV